MMTQISQAWYRRDHVDLVYAVSVSTLVFAIPPSYATMSLQSGLGHNFGDNMDNDAKQMV